MANVQFKFDPKTGLTQVNVTGPISIDEFIHYSKTFYNESSSLLVLWDIRESYFTTTNVENVNKIDLSLDKSALTRNGGKTAIICKNDEGEINTATLYASIIFNDGGTISYKTFTDKEAALNWLDPS